MNQRFVSVTMLSLLTFHSVLAEVRNVPVDYPTIQAAIDDCNEGDTVIIAPGTHTGSGNRDIDFKGKGITVRSVDPNSPIRDELQSNGSRINMGAYGGTVEASKSRQDF